MYKILEHELSGENFYAGEYPIARGIFETDEEIVKGDVLEMGEDGKVKKATNATIENLFGIASGDADGGAVSVDMTGEILISAVISPAEVDEKKLVLECRKKGIFLRKSTKSELAPAEE